MTSPTRRILSWLEYGAISSRATGRFPHSPTTKSGTEWVLQSGMPDVRRRAVVTGASGFIGSALVRHLSAEGWSVMAVDRKPFADANQPSRLADVAQDGALAGLLDEDTVVFHMS